MSFPDARLASGQGVCLPRFGFCVRIRDKSWMFALLVYCFFASLVKAGLIQWASLSVYETKEKNQCQTAEEIVKWRQVANTFFDIYSGIAQIKCSILIVSFFIHIHHIYRISFHSDNSFLSCQVCVITPPVVCWCISIYSGLQWIVFQSE